MYTQCPECSTAFRVTVEVLRQAAGKVRCGGCGYAFNSLDYLSEQKPVSPAPSPDAGQAEAPPDLPRLEADASPETASGEQGAAFLKTLDELAGPDIRIEDTGVEWRVLDTDEEDATVQAAAGEDAGELAEDADSTDWFMDESPTPVDEQLSDEPGDIDAAEIFEPEKSSSSVGEMRFDDDTPLPDDFDFDSERPESVSAPTADVRDEPAAEDFEPVDLAFGEPEDWEDLLGEVDETEEEYFAEPEAAAHDFHEEDDARDAEPLPDVDAQFAAQAEAMGIDLSGIHERAEKAEAKAAEDATIDDDLIAAAFEVEAKSREEDTETGEPAETVGGDEEIGDETREHDELRGDEEIGDGTREHDELRGDEEIGDDVEEHEELFDLEIEEPEGLLEARESELVGSTDDDARLAEELGFHEQDEADADKPEQFVPPPTEEEQTINMMIDQDLLAIAVEDEDGFASTIVQKQRSERDEPAEAQDRERTGAEDGDLQEGPLVETIIMEGEFVRDAFEERRLEAERRKSAAAKTGAASEAVVGESTTEAKPAAWKPVNYRMVAGIAALVLLLGLQYVHYSRESLAVYPAFNNSVGPIYRMFGKPVTPAWDIAGWRFEATKGSTDESDEVLTIYSRIGNKSGEALPYPLINVSLTDRFEDIIGSKVLEPGEYLAENLDTREPVAPGDTFSAVISIEAPDVNATGFKLNVCYRQPGGRLRCAIEDFK